MGNGKGIAGHQCAQGGDLEEAILGNLGLETEFSARKNRAAAKTNFAAAP